MAEKIPSWTLSDERELARLLERKGISRDTTVVVYGDRSNWWAAYALLKSGWKLRA